MSTRLQSALGAIRATAQRLDGGARDHDLLVESARKRDFVLLGEGTHGTHEFYALRREITERLIAEAGFDAVCFEADWSDVRPLDRYVRHRGTAEPLAGFRRFPRWMWRNAEVLALAEWLQQRNAAFSDAARAGVFGLDLYCLYASAEAVLRRLQETDDGQAAQARAIFLALDHLRDPMRYGSEVARGLRPDVRDDAVALARELVVTRRLAAAPATIVDADERFHVERSAKLVANAALYYRSCFEDSTRSWNVRDAHMTETLLALRNHLRANGRAGRIVVWAHNSHIGDARATEMGGRGELNLGQLLREIVGPARCLSVGFTTFTGTVTAAHDWGGEPECFRLRPARNDSYEALFRRAALDRFYLPLGDVRTQLLTEPHLERAVGVVYRPDTERDSHYFHAAMQLQFDAVYHLDETTALAPLDAAAAVPERRAAQRA